MAAVTAANASVTGGLDDDLEGTTSKARSRRGLQVREPGIGVVAVAMRSVRRRPADPSSGAMACEEGLDQALAIGGRRLVERDLVALDLQGDRGVGVAADPRPQGCEQRPE